MGEDEQGTRQGAGGSGSCEAGLVHISGNTDIVREVQRGLGRGVGGRVEELKEQPMDERGVAVREAGGR